MKFHAAIAASLAVALVVILSACGSDKKDEPATSATPGTATATATGSPAASPTVAPEMLLGLAVKPLKVVAPIPLPADVALYLESGCSGCDGPAAALERVYRAPDGTVRTEDLFRLTGATVQRPEVGEKYIMSIAASVGGDDILVSVCEGPYCGGVGQQAAEAKVSIRHSADGGIIWKNELTLDGGAAVVANAGQGNALLRRTYQPGGSFRLEFVHYPSLTTTAIELRGQAPQNARIFVPWNGPPLLLDADGLRLHRLDGAPTDGPQFDFSKLPAGSVIQDMQITGNGLGLVTFMTGKNTYSAVVELARAPEMTFKEVFSWPKERPAFYRPQGGSFDIRKWVVGVGVGRGNVPAVVDLDAGTVSPIAELVSRGEAGDRLLVTAVKSGPFARVKGTGQGDCLNVRESPALTATAVGCYSDGVLLRDLGQRRGGDGQLWNLVLTPTNREGWASTSFLDTSGRAPSLAYHPAGTRTANPAIDAIIAALETSAEVPQQLIGWQSVACKTPPINGLGGPPECPPGVADKTPIEVIPGSACEGYWRPRPAADAPVRLSVGPADFLYAVVRQDGSRGEFALIYVNPERPQFGKSVFVTGGKIVGDASGCGASPADLLKRGTSVIFAPPAP